jgi:flagellar hook-basal body complex protein FliE
MSGLDLPPLQGFGSLQRWLPQGDTVREALRAERRPAPAIGGDGGAASEGTFGGALADSLAKVQELQADVREKTQRLALGDDVAVHDLMLSMGKSEVAFNLMLEVRNKLVDAWEKLSRAVI